jgi:hypothetical protein
MSTRLPLALLSAFALVSCGGGADDKGSGIELTQGQPVTGVPTVMAPMQARALSAVSPSRSLAANAVLDATTLFDWAEGVYPQLFVGHQADRTFGAFTFRYYPATDTYVGVAGGKVYGLGAFTNGALLFIADLVDFTCIVFSCAPPPPPPAQPVYDSPVYQ